MNHQDFVRRIDSNRNPLSIFDIQLLESKGIADIHRLPFSIKVLVENLLRKLDNDIVTEPDLLAISRWRKHYDEPPEIPYHPARVLMQDFTGVPAVVDLAVMRDAVKGMGGDPAVINPLVPVELVVDHSIQVDSFGTPDALKHNVAKEYERNKERYELLKWAQKSFDHFSVVPPNSGICHQVNLEYLGRVVITEDTESGTFAFPDTLVGTDSHTTMINGLGVMGWGVGGIEAEAVMLGQPYYMSIPEVVGVRLTGALKPGVTATDLVLRITEMLRSENVVEKFVEFYGPGMKQLTLTDRATIANMSPEYGATMGFFPVDEKTLEYLKITNREDRADIVASYTRETGLFYDGSNDPDYSKTIVFDISEVEPSVAGPSRPQDRIVLADLKQKFSRMVDRDASKGPASGVPKHTMANNGHRSTREPKDAPQSAADGICDGSVVIAAITSCTNTSNPFAMLGAGLLAKKAVEKGVQVPSYVKTSLAPGSRVVVDYLNDAGLMTYLEALGFHLAAFGCTTCIGNSGPLDPQIEKAIVDHQLTVAAVLSGNRNFEARIHQKIRANFLASPMLVILYAIAGRMDIDVTREPIAFDENRVPVYMKDVWPEDEEIQGLVAKHIRQSFYAEQYGRIFQGDEFWGKLAVTDSTTFAWDENSTYIRKPPYFDGFQLKASKPADVVDADALLVLGDSVTTDHISPAGAIPEAYPAGKYLMDKGVPPDKFNSYGSRRGNHEVMMRGTFGNIRIKNQLVSPKEGSYTRVFPEKKEVFVYEAAMKAIQAGKPLVVLGGIEYGTGSSRDWAAKGTRLLNVKAVLAKSFERIHRSNLVGMGVLPLVFNGEDTWESLGLDGTETFSINGIENMTPRKQLQVKAMSRDGKKTAFNVTSRLDTAVDVAYFENGGILPYVLRKMMGAKG
ncbi:MAG: aconitate hydratase AcnA [Deltaproteobacteria bacterium]|jgi:aconitate hydratase|nr:aconitate hydratase AcnA [Deltaproteobacteria bacterium]